jgi:predicted nucleic acid-binding protein
MLNVVDSSGWLEYFTGGQNAAFFAPLIEKPARLVIPSISILEVFKRVLQQRDEAASLQAVALMMQGKVVDLTASLAIEAARLGLAYKLPLADSVIFSTANAYKAVLWTQDADFKGLPGVRYIPKQV